MGFGVLMLLWSKCAHVPKCPCVAELGYLKLVFKCPEQMSEIGSFGCKTVFYDVSRNDGPQVDSGTVFAVIDVSCLYGSIQYVPKAERGGGQWPLKMM